MSYTYSPLDRKNNEIRLLTLHKPSKGRKYLRKRINCSLTIHSIDCYPLFPDDEWSTSFRSGCSLGGSDEDDSDSAALDNDEWLTESDTSSSPSSTSFSRFVREMDAKSPSPCPELSETEEQLPRRSHTVMWEWHSDSSRTGYRSTSPASTAGESFSGGSHSSNSWKTLSSEPTSDFDALSYVWGDMKGKKPIYIDGKPLLVTRALYEILDNFRRHSQIAGRYLWVDAVCVNQEDLGERSSQVNLMSDIYGTASVVRFWLGRSTKESEGLVGLIQQISELPSTALMDLLKQRRTQDIVRNIMERKSVWVVTTSMRTDDGWIHSRWWKRIWVVQEYTHARKTMTHIGDLQISFRKIQSALRWLLEDVLRQSNESLPPEFTRYLNRLEVFKDASHGADRLERMMDISFAAEATDPRDLVYGILSMLYREMEKDWDRDGDVLKRDTGTDIRPDYTLSVGQVFADMTKIRLRNDRELYFLSFAGTYEGKYENLPSWAVDLTRECASLGCRFKGCEHCLLPHIGGYYDDTKRKNQPERLAIRAKIVDEIKSIISMPNTPNTNPPSGCANDTPLLARLFKHLRSFLEADVNTENSSTLPFWDVVLMYDKHNACDEWYKDATRVSNSKHVAFTENLDRWLDGDNNDIVDDETFKALDISKLLARRYFTTANGKFGSIDDRSTQVGDQVAAAVGSRAALIVRQHENSLSQTYQLIGAAYVQDLMNGEAISAAAALAGLDVKKTGLSNLFEPMTLA